MRIRTTQIMKTTPELLWPLLTNSRMDVPGCFCLGLPRPVACELPKSSGGVGAERRCISDRGTVVQRITTWIPCRQLQFQMVTTDHNWGPCVESLEEDFQLEKCAQGTRITRTTNIRASGIFKVFKEIGFCIGLKRVHLYVFRNWRTESEGNSAAV